MYKILIIFNTVFNVMLIIHFIFKYYKVRFSFDTYDVNGKICSYTLFYGNGRWSKRIFSLSIRNIRDEETKEKVRQLLNPRNPNVRQTLGAICSWTNDADELIYFKKHYSIVNAEYVMTVISEQIKRKGIVLTEKQHKLIYG